MKTYKAPPGIAEVTLTSDEVTTIGTTSGNPDFYTVVIWYIPTDKILCSKALKEYFTSIRGQIMSAERFAVTLKEAITEAIEPAECKVTVIQKPRGGVEIKAVA